MATVQVNFKVDAQLKERAESIFERLGLTTSQAFKVFLSKVVDEKGIPFRLNISNDDNSHYEEITRDDLNETTKRSIIETRTNMDKLPKYHSAKELLESMDIYVGNN